MVYQSCFRKLDVLSLREKYGIPPNFSIRVRFTRGHPDNLPARCLYFYVVQLDVGLCFLVPPFGALLFNVPLNQLLPESLSLLASYAMLVLYLGEEPSAE